MDMNHESPKNYLGIKTVVPQCTPSAYIQTSKRWDVYPAILVLVMTHSYVYPIHGTDLVTVSGRPAFGHGAREGTHLLFVPGLHFYHLAAMCFL